MGRYFLDSYYMIGGGTIGALRPAMLDVSQNYYDAYTQEPCVIRFVRSALSTTASIRVTVTELDGGGQSVAAYVTFDNADTQYFDLTEILRCWMLRPAATLTAARPRTRYLLSIEEFNSGGTALGHRDITVYAYDARDPDDAKYNTQLPDTFRMIADATLTDWQAATVRATVDNCELGVYDQDGVPITTFTSDAGDMYSAQWRFRHNVAALAAKVTLGTEAEQMTARVVWEGCAANKVQLRWWSPECGGYKSVAAEMLGVAADKSGDAAYIKAFNDVWAARLADGIRCRIPLCTMRDVMYHRDLYASDEVEMRWSVGVYSYSKRVRITGAPPDAPITGVVDMPFVMQLSEVSSLW